MKRKLIAVSTAFIILVSCIAPSACAASKNFTDINQGDWYKEAVESVVDKELFSGVSDTEFAPQEAMTRAMFVQVLANFTDNYTNPQTDEIALFTDVKKDAWYYNAVQWAAKNGIVSGKGDAIFDPNGQITRQEMITMLFNYALKTGEVTSFQADALSGFTDREGLSDWAATAVWWAVSNQIITGTGQNELSPTAVSTRAQVAAMFSNANGIMESRETIPVIVNAPDDPDKDYLDILSDSLSLDELSKGKDMGTGDTSLMAPYTAYTGFEDYPDVTAYFIRYSGGILGLYYISVPINNLFPNLAGKTAGEVIGTLGASASLNSYEGVLNPRVITEPFNSPNIIYQTKEFTYILKLNKETLKVDANAEVYIASGSDYREVVEIPEDLTVPLEFKGTTICTLSLPESYRQCIIYRKELLYSHEDLYEEGGIFFMEPIQELRYGGWMDGGTLFSVRVVEKAVMDNPDDDTPVVNYEIQQNFELNGEAYTLLVTKSQYSYTDTDQEVIDSFKTMKAEIDNIIDGIEINSALALID